MLGDANLAGDIAERLLAEGVYVIGFSYPVVPQGKARIRMQISAAHDEDDLDRAVDAFARGAQRVPARRRKAPAAVRHTGCHGDVTCRSVVRCRCRRLGAAAGGRDGARMRSWTRRCCRS